VKIAFVIVVVIVMILLSTAWLRQRADASESTESVDTTAVDLFHTLDGVDLIIALQERVALRESEVGFDGLSEPERVFLCVQDVESEVNNGGFLQYFYNSSGNRALFASRSFETIGASHTAGIVKRACAVFPNGEPPSDRTEREELLERIEEQIEDALSELDDAFYEYNDDLENLVLTYVKKHQADFK